MCQTESKTEKGLPRVNRRQASLGQGSREQGNIMQKLSYVLFGMVLGGVAVASLGAVVAETKPNPAYLVVSGRTINAEGLEPYRAAAGPLAEAAGLKILARNAVPAAHVLEGEWPYEGTLTIEQFDSMETVLAFWHSDGYQAAKKLREGKVELDFVVAVSGAD